jgi:lactate dehydrogenase-like 2-hydroxyacid dehydrogenase
LQIPDIGLRQAQPPGKKIGKKNSLPNPDFDRLIVCGLITILLSSRLFSFIKKNSINYDLVNLMPKNGLLVNTARKEVINEADLLRLMNDRADLKYITDIMPVHHDEFADHFPGRYFSTPKKMGAQTAEANINAGIAAARQIVGFLKDGCEKYRVNKK